MSSSSDPPHVAYFDVFEVDLRVGDLRRPGSTIRLQDKPLQILSLLVEHAGQVVTREELEKRLWPDGVIVDFEHNINSAVNRLRKALGDDAEHPRFIETLPRHGYRFIAPVGDLTSRPFSGAGTWIREAGRAGGPLRRHWIAAAVGAALAIVVILYALIVADLHDRVSRKLPPPRIETVAVLPLENLSGDPGQQYFADGMTEELITDLGKIRVLRVISRTSVLQYKRTRKPLPEIARELNVDAIVEGAVRCSGDRVRITAQLIDARTDRHLWAVTFERNMGDVLSLQDEVARAIASQVRIKLAPQAPGGRSKH